MYVYTHAHTQLCLTLCDRQAPQSMAFFRHEYWSGLPNSYINVKLYTNCILIAVT